MRSIAIGIMVTLPLGCELVVPSDVHYTDGGPLDVAQATDSPSVDDGSVAIGPGGLCVCGAIDGGSGPFSNGEGCCVPKGGGAPFCTSDSTDCAGSGGLFVGCQTSAIDSPCCWSNLSATGSTAELQPAGSCGARPLSCTATTDCNGTGTCELATCAGMTVGACGSSTPTCP